MEIIRAIRNIRAEAEAAPSKKLRAVILPANKSAQTVKNGEAYIKNLANITEVIFIENKSEAPEEAMSAVTGGAEIYIPLEDLVDYEAEYARLSKEEKRLKAEVARACGKLSNQGFVSKAHEKVIREEKEKLEKYEDMLGKVSARLAKVAEKTGR